MKLIWEVSVAIAVVAAVSVASSRLIDDGGVQAVMKDEVPPLVDEWGGNSGSQAVRYAAFIPAGIAVFVGVRAGEADYDRDALYDGLIRGIPYGFHHEIMRNDNLAAAIRARHRQLARIASEDTEQRFFDMFPEWWASHTTCMTPKEELETIRMLAPEIGARIAAKNAEFERLAAREVNGTLTVSERTTYLADELRVPHLVQHPASSWQVAGDWIEVDPSDAFSRHESDGPLVRMCPDEGHSYGLHIKACFGYVNIDLHRNFGQSLGYGHLAPTVLGRAVYRNLEQSVGARDFVLKMMEDEGEKVALLAQAEHNVSSLPATQVSSGFEEQRVKSEYERLRCSQ